MVSLLIGEGAHGKDIEAIAERCHRPLFTLDEGKGDWQKAPPVDILIGVNDPKVRRDIARRWLHNAAEPLIDPSVIRGPGVRLGAGCIVAPNAVLLRDVWLGEHVHVNYASTLTRCTVGAFTTIAPGVTICGDVQIGEAVFIGAGATICNLLSIGNGATVAAGAVVVDNVPAGATVRGVPAR